MQRYIMLLFHPMIEEGEARLVVEAPESSQRKRHVHPLPFSFFLSLSSHIFSTSATTSSTASSAISTM